MSKRFFDWFPREKLMIELIQKYPVIYEQGPKRKSALCTAWNRVISESGMEGSVCKRIWLKIKQEYAQLMILINTKKITREAVVLSQLSKYLDGRLSFLDPYITKITNTTPVAIQKKIWKLFEVKFQNSVKNMHNYSDIPFIVRHKQVKTLLSRREEEDDDLESTDMEYIHEIVENTIQRKLRQLLGDITEPNKYESKEKTPEHIDLGLESNKIMNVHMDTEYDDARDKNSTLDTVLAHVSEEFSSNRLIDTIVIDNDDTTNNVQNESHCTVDEVIDNYLRKFFNELGEVTSMELSTEKQLILKQKINALVTKTFLD